MNYILNEILKMKIPKFSFLFEIFSKPNIAFLTITPAIAVAPVVNIWSAISILGILFLCDFLTGLLASYFMWKSKTDKTDKWFFGKGEGFSSDKFKKMFVKLIIYLGTPLVVQEFQSVFHIKPFRYEIFSNAELSIATFLILIFCLNEGFSIFHENLPKCGFNLWDRIKSMIGFYKEIKNEIAE